MIGDQAYIYINYFSGFMTLIALLAVFFLYKSTHTVGEGKSMREIGQGFLRIVTNWRLLIRDLYYHGILDGAAPTLCYDAKVCNSYGR